MQILDLGGEWQVQREAKGKAIPATVPGDVYSDLLAAKEIIDPFYRDNENKLQWIGETDWLYSRSFTVGKDLLARECVLLHCDGLDTLATVRLNGKKVASTDNMFRTWEWDVRKFLKAGQNRIEVEFASTFPYIRQRQAERPLPWWGSANSLQRSECHGWIRKQACNYGWDWGIKAATCGIWRPLRLIGFDSARLDDVQVTQDHSRKGEVVLNVRIAAEKLGKAKLATRVLVRRQGQVVAEGEAKLAGSHATVALRVRQPELWWPNGMGAQPLYDLQVLLTDAKGQLLDTTHRRLGLRTLRLDRHEDQWGESFQFVVNGIPFFAKGANWIPADGVLGRLTPEWYRHLVADAAAVNMNFLRAWGGGIYEADVFYDACDELGICVWQDFMFACATYPTFDDAFMANCEAEFRDNVRRLRHHPSIALWCGNNELEQGLVGPEWTAHQMSWDDYGKLFDKLLPEVLAELDPERDYWPCSPHSPHGDRREHWNPKWGDAHLWDVWHGKKPFEWYRTCEHRFNSEFGFQSFPEPKTAYAYTAPEDRNVTSWVMEHHQRSGIGNTTIMQYMLDWFRLPVGYENTLWASQVLQGMAIKYACEHWRRSMPRGMGTLYWQINDTWPVASWSSVDYYGRWKALHYMARHFFAPLLVSGLEDPQAGTVEVHVTSDLPTPTAGTVRWVVTDLAGTELLSGKKAIKAPARANRTVETLHLDKLIARHGARGLLVWLELDANGETSSRNLVLFARPKHLELSRKPGLAATVKEQAGGSFAVTLKSKQPALWTWVELADVDARCSDNFVHLRPGAPVTIVMTPARSLSKAEFQEKLQLRSLVDTYREE